MCRNLGRRTSEGHASTTRPLIRTPHCAGEYQTVRLLHEITSDGDIIGDDGEAYALFSFDPEAIEDFPD